MEQNNEQAAPIAESANSEMIARREFLKKVGKASATAPAVGLLLAASFKSDPAQAGGGSGSAVSGGSS